MHWSWSNFALFLCILLLGTIAASPASTVERDHDIVPEDYFDIGTVYACVVSPGSQYAAYVESRWGEGKEGRQNDLWVVDLGSRHKLRLTFGGFGASHPIWNRDGRWIYFTGLNKRAGEEKPPYDGSRQVWRVSPTGGEPFPVTRTVDGMKQFDLAHDGRTLYYTTGEENYTEEWRDLRKKYTDLQYGHGVGHLDAVHRLDLTSWRDEEVMAPEQVIHEMALSPDGTRLATIDHCNNHCASVSGSLGARDNSKERMESCVVCLLSRRS